MLMNMFGVRIMFINQHKTNHENVYVYVMVCGVSYRFTKSLMTTYALYIMHGIIVKNKLTEPRKL